MANIHFYLRPGQANKKGQQSIIMRVTHNYIRPIFFLGFMVHPRYWSQLNQKVKPPRDGEADKFKQDFLEILDEYIESSKAVRANRTIVCYGTFKNFLLDFEKDTKYKVDLHEINFKFFDNLRTYAFVKRKARDNYFAKIISNLKAFLTWCQKRGYVKDLTFKDFKAVEREKDVIYLTLDELMTLLNFKFESPRRARARDLFCFMCFTGMRVSDLRNLKKENIKEGQIFKTIVKTHKTEVIPLNQFAQAILAKYEHLEMTPLPKLSSQKLNDHIKDCCEEAEINTRVHYVDYSGGKAREHSEPKWKLITNHTARKTFITNSIVLGMNTKTIKDITGHKKDSVFNKYVKISEEFKKLEMERTWDSIPQKQNTSIPDKKR